MDLDAIRNIIGIIGNVISFGLFMSPAPTFFTIIKKGDVEEFSPNPYMATILNCAMWVFYGMPFVHPNSVLVVTINGFGLLMEIIYISIYLNYAGDKKKRMYVIRMLAGELLFFIIVAVVTLAFFHTTDRRSMVVGTIAVVFNILMYGMPLDVMLMVIKTKSSEYLPFYLLLANFLNGSVWLAYAQIHFDLYLTISNGSGLLLGLAQLTLYACYYKSTPKRGDTKNGVQLSSYDNEKGVV